MGKAIIYYILLLIAAIGAIGYFVLDSINFNNHYEERVSVSVSVDSSFPTFELTGYQSQNAVLQIGQDINPDLFADDTYATIMIDNETNEPIVAYNALRRIYPASTTKVMTALVVCDALNEGKISLDDQVTLQHDTSITDESAMKSSLGKGCTISVRNLLYGMLMKSYNDFAVILAEYVGGTEADFCQMMNNKAYQIGATASHFVNPHGLHEDDHYTTAYDMYLIVREAKKHEIIREIDSYNTFTFSYIDANGYEQSDSISPTNQFLSGGYQLPSNITMETWKTGTTRKAGSCLVMNVLVNNNSYTLFVADSIGPDDLYGKIGTLFNMTN
ncbi:MAG: serine hydrolase [Eubacterium sp.]|nr:serine hydrolase [Eubacterium sp.]